MNKKIYSIILLISLGFPQYTEDLDILQSQANKYFDDGDYNNAIILYEDLLAEQEAILGQDNSEIGETLYNLGELYMLINMPDIANYYFNESINIFNQELQIRKDSIKIPLTQLLNIYILKNDSLMIDTIEKQLNLITNIFETKNNINDIYSNESDSVYTTNEDLALDDMNFGLSYLEHGLYSEATLQFNTALNRNTKNLSLQFFKDFFQKIVY